MISYHSCIQSLNVLGKHLVVDLRADAGEHWAKMFFEAAKRDLIKQGRDADFCT